MMKKVLIFKAIAMTAVFAASFSVPAFAGFEWKQPASRASAAVDGDFSMPAQKVPGIEAVSLLPDSKSVSSSAEFVSGFGSDMPLSVALQQILPAAYGFSFGPGVNREVSVSWQGEKPWKDVLTEMLTPEGLGFSVEGDNVVVTQLAGGKKPVVVSKKTRADMIPSGFGMDEGKPQALAAAPTPLTEAPAVSAMPAPVVAPAPAPVTIRRNRAEAQPTFMTSAPAWKASRGQTLRNILNDWSKEASVGLHWSIDYDYKLNNDLAYAGDYNQAVAQLLEKFSTVRPQPYGKLHQAQDGNKVLVINSYDVSN